MSNTIYKKENCIYYRELDDLISWCDNLKVDSIFCKELCSKADYTIKELKEV